MKARGTWILVIVVLLLVQTAAFAQLNSSLLATFRPRSVGPAQMGGRISDIAVSYQNPSIFYVGTASGGLYKTQNGGNTWELQFDKEGSIAVGDVAVNPDDANVVWVGTGEANNRQSTCWGDGIYKSTDGGRTWRNMGLRDSQHIGRIVIDPTNTDIVYVAAAGHLWGPNKERGVFKTMDGGSTWTNVLFIDENTGINDLIIDPSNPKILIAAAYQRQRSGWGFNGGGPGSGIYKSSDAGRNWTRLSQGLPSVDMGRIGLDIYLRNPNVVYATIEAEAVTGKAAADQATGIYRSDDKGESWAKVSTTNPRPMYFSQIRVDPNNADRLYLSGVSFTTSIDGGKTFTAAGAGVHDDSHAIWINPQDSNQLLLGTDGGLWGSRDRSGTWDHINNFAIGQFYNIAADMRKPYYIYGGMQDNYTWGGPSSTRDRVGIVNDDWFQVNGGDGMYVAVDPTDYNIVYTNSQNGAIIRYDFKTGERKRIQPQPKTGEPAYRWNWTSPILISPHDAKIVYTGANVLFKSADRGHTWAPISPDLTSKTNRDELRLMGVAGKDIKIAKNDGMSSFGNITTISESPRRAGLIYVGTDDGLIQVTRDSGKTWTNVADKISDVPKLIYVSRVFASQHTDGLVYASFDGHRSDDYAPHVYTSPDYGQTWRAINGNLPRGSVYVVKEDPKNANLLYVGTEFGLFISNDRGASWSKWTSLGTVAVYDVLIHPRDNDLIVASHGRSFQIFDDISWLQQFTETAQAAPVQLFTARATSEFIYSNNKGFLGGRDYRAANPDFGAYINYYLKADAAQPVLISITDASGKTIRELEGPKEAGLHRVPWDLRTAPLAQTAKPIITGPLVLPGDYQVKISAAAQNLTQTVHVDADPQVQISDADRRKLYDTLSTLTNMQITVTQASDSLTKMNQQMTQINETLKALASVPAPLRTATDNATKQIADFRQRLTGQRAPADAGEGPPAAGPGGQALQNLINGLKQEIAGSQSVPTAQQSERFDEYFTRLNELTGQVNNLISTVMPEVFRQLNNANLVPGIGATIKPPVKP